MPMVKQIEDTIREANLVALPAPPPDGLECGLQRKYLGLGARQLLVMESLDQLSRVHNSRSYLAYDNTRCHIRQFGRFRKRGPCTHGYRQHSNDCVTGSRHVEDFPCFCAQVSNITSRSDKR